jgi:hypothetical protein
LAFTPPGGRKAGYEFGAFDGGAASGVSRWRRGHISRAGIPHCESP